MPNDGVSDVESGCTDSWGGNWTVAGNCQEGTLVGTCVLSGNATGGGESAVMEVYEPTSASTGEDSICGRDGTWTDA